MADELGKIRVAVESEGTEEASERIEETGESMEGMQMPGMGGGDVGKAAGMGGAIGGAIGSILQAVIGDTLEGLMKIAKTIMTMVTALTGSVVGILGMAASLEPVQEMLDALTKVFQAYFVPMAMMLLKLLSPVLRFMVKHLPDMMNFYDNPGGLFKSAMKEALSSAWGTLTESLGSIWDLLTQSKKSIFEWISNVKKDIFEWIVNTTKSIWMWIDDVEKQIWYWIVDTTKDIFEWILNIKKSIWEWILNIKKSIWEWILNIKKSIWDWVIDIKKSIWDWVKTPMINLADYFNIGGSDDSDGGFLSGIGDILGSRQSGGMIPKTGLYKLHKNEAVFNQDQLRALGRMINGGGRGKSVNIEMSGDLESLYKVDKLNPNSPGGL